MEPSHVVSRNTNVTLRCRANVVSVEKALSREYTIYKDGNAIYNKTSSTSEDLLYHLSEVRVSDNGKYSCRISAEGQQATSSAKKLEVTGWFVAMDTGVMSSANVVRYQ